MSDEKTRELQKKVEAGDGTVNDAGALANFGARTQNVELFSSGLVAGLKMFSLKEQRAIIKDIVDSVADHIESERASNSKEFQSTKSFEIPWSTFGKTTPEEFLSRLYDIVEDAIAGKPRPEMNVPDGYTNTYYSRFAKKTNNTDKIKEKLLNTFGKYGGSFVISCSTPVRVYALHEAPTEEEKERRKKEREMAIILEKKEKQEKALKEIQIKENELKVQLAKLKERQERAKKSLEKATKVLDAQ